MAKLNVPGVRMLNGEQRLRRVVMACLLWEDQFYVDGKTIAENIVEAANAVTPNVLSKVAIEARNEHNLRHVPLLLTAELAKRGGSIVADTLVQVIQRADELTEFLAVYWRNGKVPLGKQVKTGLARAFGKFNAYALAKYNRDGAIKLRDVLFLVHAKPKDEAQAALWKQLVDGTLPAPDTWEVALSAGANKRETWERMLAEGSLGYMALLRNLRNMMDVGVDTAIVRDAILARKGAQRVLPFRYVAAARACPQMEPELDIALQAAVQELSLLHGRTIVLVDVSGSMNNKLSAKSDLMRMDAAATLASVLNCESLRVFSFSNTLAECPPRRGMAGVDAIVRSQAHGGTALAGAIAAVNAMPHDRLIVITDEQSTDGRVPDPVCANAYMVNVASYKNGVGYGRWKHIDGFSEGIIKWITESEKC